MSKQFQFLSKEWPEIYKAATEAEDLAYSYPRAACTTSRTTLELAINWLYSNDENLTKPSKNDLVDKIFEPSFKNLLGNTLHQKCNFIRILGNRAAHGNEPVTVKDAISVLNDLFHLCYWLVYEYGHTKPDPIATFDPDLLPKIQALSAQQAEAAQIPEIDRLGIYLSGRADHRGIAFSENSEHQNISRDHCDESDASVDLPNTTIINESDTLVDLPDTTIINESDTSVDLPDVIVIDESDTSVDRDISSLSNIGIQSSLITLTPASPQPQINVTPPAITPMEQAFIVSLKRAGIASLSLSFLGLFVITYLVNASYVKTDSCSDITAKMLAAKVSVKQVNKIYWQKHPNKFNKLIGKDDAALRQEWCQIAGELVDKKMNQ